LAAPEAAGCEQAHECLLAVSVLERLSPDMGATNVIRLESSWKERLHTRAPNGLNDN